MSPYHSVQLTLCVFMSTWQKHNYSDNADLGGMGKLLIFRAPVRLEAEGEQPPANSSGGKNAQIRPRPIREAARFKRTGEKHAHCAAAFHNTGIADRR